MKIYTALLRHDAEPVLVREGFAWGALFFGPFWLFAHRAWIAAAISLAVYVLIAALAPQPAGGPYSVTVQGTNTITISDVLIGDV